MSPLSPVTLSVSRISGIYVRWYHNSEEVLKKSAWTLRLWRKCASSTVAVTHISPVLQSTAHQSEDFEIYGNVQIETPKTNTVTYTVHVGNGCDPSMPNGIEPKQPVVIGQSDHPEAMSPEAIPVTAAFRLMPRMVQPISSTPFLTANNPGPPPSSMLSRCLLPVTGWLLSWHKL